MQLTCEFETLLRNENYGLMGLSQFNDLHDNNTLTLLYLNECLPLPLWVKYEKELSLIILGK